MRTMSGSLAFALLCAFGCADSQSRSNAALPYRVLVKEVVLVDGDRPRETDRKKEPKTPAYFQSAAATTRHLAGALQRTGIFTQVFTSSSASGGTAVAPDLIVEVEIRNRDFGPGRPSIIGASLSTIAWLFVGPLSWLIDDRAYPESKVSMHVRIRSVDDDPDRGDRGQVGPLFEDILPLTGLTLSFVQRAGAKHLFLNVLIPPFVGNGDPEVAGRSLAEQSTEYFAASESLRIVSSFPLRYLERKGCFLSYDSESRSLDIISRVALDRIEIQSSHGQRTVDEDQLGLLVKEAKEERESLESRLSEEIPGLLGATSDRVRYHSVRLEDDETGFVRVTATIEGGGKARWTIDRRSPSSPAVVAGGKQGGELTLSPTRRPRDPNSD